MKLEFKMYDNSDSYNKYKYREEGVYCMDWNSLARLGRTPWFHWILDMKFKVFSEP
jgi:hypothetical protein